jgi:hypothetical protein
MLLAELLIAKTTQSHKGAGALKEAGFRPDDKGLSENFPATKKSRR